MHDGAGYFNEELDDVKKTNFKLYAADSRVAQEFNLTPSMMRETL